MSEETATIYDWDALGRGEKIPVEAEKIYGIRMIEGNTHGWITYSQAENKYRVNIRSRGYKLVRDDGAELPLHKDYPIAKEHMRYLMGFAKKRTSKYLTEKNWVRE